MAQARSAARARAAAAAAGLTIVDLREQALRVEFFDVGAVAYFLHKVLRTVPGFSVERYRDRLAALHRHIAAAGSFVAHSQRYLVEARRTA